MQPCELVTAISTLACLIAKDKTADELSLLGAVFTQIGDSLATIAAQQIINSPNDEDED